MPAKGRLSEYHAFILDVDGVLVRGGEPIAGSVEGMRCLQAMGRVVLLTNNSARSRAQTSERLAGMGFLVRPEDVISTSFMAAQVLSQGGVPRRVFVLGEEGLREELAAAGHDIVPRDGADWLVAGICWGLSYDLLSDALAMLSAGARFLATNRDATFPTPTGEGPGAGAIVGAIEGMGYAPEVVVGKPCGLGYRLALERLGVPASEVLMIGDRLETDILGARRAGIPSALVLSGVTTVEEIAEKGIRPTWVADNLKAASDGDLTDVHDIG